MSRRHAIVAFLAVLAALAVAAVLVVRPAGPTAGSAPAPVAPVPMTTQWPTDQPAFRPPTGTTPVLGVNYHAMWDDMTDEVRAGVLDRLQAAGVQWVRMDIAWQQLQPVGPDSFDLNWGVPRIDERIAEVSRRGMKVLLLVYWGPEWSTGTTDKNGVPSDPRDYGRAVAWAAERWAGQVQAIELWNEPDLDTFLADTSVETYTALVTAGYDAIKAVSPQTFVVAGAPTYVRTEWYAEFFRLGGGGHFDALGVHPYVGRSDQPPETCGTGADQQFHPCNVGPLIELMRQNGSGDKQIWATEYGWSAHDNSGNPEPWQRGVPAEKQAEYLLRMQSYLSRWPQVAASFWYTDRNTAEGDVHEDNFGLLERDLSPKPAYYAMMCAASGRCGP